MDGTNKHLPPKWKIIFQTFTSWWLNQPIWKICSSNWIISPNRIENKKYLSCQPLVHFYVFHVSFREGWPWFPLRMLQSCGFVVLLLVRFQCLVNINQTRTHFGFLLVWIWSTQQRKWCKLLQAKQTLKSQPPLYQNQGNILGNLRAQTITSI